MIGRLLPRTHTEMRELQPWGDWHPSSMSAAGTNVNTTSALQLLTVYGCVALIADTIATLPLDVFRKQGADSVEVLKPGWLEQPNGRDNIVEFVTQVLTSLLLDGNAYLTWAANTVGGVTQITAIDPAEVDIRDEGGNVVYTVKSQRFAGRLLHIKAVMRPGSLKGLSPLEAARQSIGVGLAAQEFGGRFFGNGITMSGVIELPKEAGEPSPEMARTMRDSFARDNSGLARAWMPGLLYGGAAWKQLSVTPEQGQFLETRKFQAAEIAAQMFRVDPTLLGIPVDGKSLTYANLEQRGIHLVQFTLLPWIVRLERTLTALLPRPQFAKFNVAGLQRADLKTRYEAYSIGLGGAPFLTVEEPREKEDLPTDVASMSKIPVAAAPTSGD